MPSGTLVCKEGMEMINKIAIQIHPKDTVAVVLTDVPAGALICGVKATENIPQGHKMALLPINFGEKVIKYGFSIGHATRDIAPGAWVHEHNMTTDLSGHQEYTYQPCDCHIPTLETMTFQGYQRTDGRVAIRNEIWVIPTVGCVNDVAKALVNNNQDLVKGTIDGLYAFTHPYGCSQTGDDHANTRKLLAALAKHPNAGAVLIVGLGCENLTKAQFLEELGDYDPNRICFLTCQESADEIREGRQLLEKCATYASQFRRQTLPASGLVVGMKCGGSDGLSGITANPVVGRFSDRLVAMGGTTVLTEVPEMFGAEGFLLNRCRNEQVFGKAVDMLNRFKDYLIRHGEVLYENPSPGNREGGITTLEDKACGCVQKGGEAPIVDVLGYGDILKETGLNMLYGPGNDLVSTTALTAAGAHMVLFTTGRGTPFGAPAPTLKIATNTPLANKKVNWIDFNAGTVADGTDSLDDAADGLLQLVLRVASGAKTRAEQNGCREIAIFKDGITL